MHAYSAWVTPPVALFLGLSFALLCGQAHPKFNKKISKYLLQEKKKDKLIIVSTHIKEDLDNLSDEIYSFDNGTVKKA